MKGSGHNNSHFITVAQMSQDSIQSRGDYFSSDSTLRGIGCRWLLTFSRCSHLSRGIIVQMVSWSYPWVLQLVGSRCGGPSHILLSPTAEKYCCVAGRAAHTHMHTHCKTQCCCKESFNPLTFKIVSFFCKQAKQKRLFHLLIFQRFSSVFFLECKILIFDILNRLNKC